jgi:cell division protein FtsN
MTPSRDDDVRPEPGESEELEEEPRRSILAATWFRLLIVVVVVGAITAVSVPYLMDSMRVSSPPLPIVAPSEPPAIVTNAPPAPPATSPATPSSSPMNQTKSPDAATTASAVTSPPAVTTASPPAPSAPVSSPDRATTGAASRSAPPHAPAPTAPAPPAAPAKPKPALTPEGSPPATTSEKVARRDVPMPPANAREITTSTERAGDERGDFWVQVGAFRDPETAKQVAARLRENSFSVDESSLALSPRAASTPVPSSVAARDPAPSTGAGTDLYRVVVTDASAGDLASKVSARGFTAEASPEGAVIRPTLPLRDAVAISQQLAADGFKVQVKRSRPADGKPGPPPRPAPAPSVAQADTLHRVRVGAFADRASAVAALRKLQALGYTPFIARGRE